MVSAGVVRLALELPPEDRLELARPLVESVVAPDSLTQALTDGIRRVEDVVTERVKRLSEEEYRAAGSAMTAQLNGTALKQ
jgi:hypothetical protein